MRIIAHTEFRLVGVTFFLGFHDLIPGRKTPMISSRAIVKAQPGDVIEDIWQLDGVWIDGIELVAPVHPILEACEGGSYRVKVSRLGEEYHSPVEIPGLMTIED